MKTRVNDCRRPSSRDFRTTETVLVKKQTTKANPLNVRRHLSVGKGVFDNTRILLFELRKINWWQRVVPSVFVRISEME